MAEIQARNQQLTFINKVEQNGFLEKHQIICTENSNRIEIDRRTIPLNLIISNQL